MKAKLNTPLQCGECGSLLQYHQENKYVRCTQLKCSQRLINYLVPTIELHTEDQPEEAPKRGKSKGTATKD